MMSTFPEGNALVYCQGAFNTPNGKTAHGLVRFTQRYRVLSVIDSRYTGQDAVFVLDGKPAGIPVYESVQDAFQYTRDSGKPATHLVVGLAPDGGRLSASAREDIKTAIQLGLNVDCGLHDFLSEDSEISHLAAKNGVQIRDVRKTPPRCELHFFSGKIEEVTALKVALLGTDSAVGKRTTAWKLVQALDHAGISAQMVGTGQIEHAVWTAWKETDSKVIVIEGQGSLMNPAYPGGFEILAAGRPDLVVLQHAPARRDYDGFPGYPIQPLARQIQAVELLSGKPVVAVTINHEGIEPDEIANVCRSIHKETGLPTFDVLTQGAEGLADVVWSRRKK
jgi:uncharacterized NAD-dependent epimerase/dehydratase family protein